MEEFNSAKNWHICNLADHENSIDAFSWCLYDKSEYKFYVSWVALDWYFENEQDALLFTMRWSTT